MSRKSNTLESFSGFGEMMRGSNKYEVVDKLFFRGEGVVTY